MTPEERKTLRARIDLGIKAAIATALEEHRRAGRKVAIWRDGQVVQIIPPATADSMAVREEPPESSGGRRGARSGSGPEAEK